MNKNRLFTVFTVVFAIFIVIAIFITLWYWGDDYPDFNEFRQEYDIPGLQDGATPQGLGSYNNATYAVTAEDGSSSNITQDIYVLSAYFKDQPSKLYFNGSTTGYIGAVTVKDKDSGEVLTGHFGGVAMNGNKIWIADDSIIYVLSYSSTIEAAKENGEVETLSKFHSNCRASFLYYYDDTSASNSDKLYVGEFYQEGRYETDTTHHVTTKNSGEEQRAFAYQYSVTSLSSNIYGLTTLSTSSGLAGDDVVPKVERIFSLPNEVQGFARTQSGALVLSVSYGLKNSQLLYYQYSSTGTEDSYIDTSSNRTMYTTLTGEKFFRYRKADGSEIRKNRTETVPNGIQYTDETSLYVYFVDSSCLLRTYSVPSMTEGLTVKFDRIYVLFESGAKKYRLFVRQPISNIYSFIPRVK